MSGEEELPSFAMTDTSLRICSSFSFVCFMMYVGHIIREHLSCTRRIMMPASLIGGIVAIIFIQVVSISESAGTVLKHDWIVGWSQVPGFLINVIFATLFLGASPPSMSEAYSYAAPQLAYGLVLAFSNWMIACMVTAVILIPAWDTNVLFGSIFPVGFEGGHGTAAGLKGTYNALGFPEGGDLAVTSATIGILFGVTFGTLLCNIGDRYGWTMSSWERSQTQYDLEDTSSEETDEALHNKNAVNPEALKDIPHQNSVSEEPEDAEVVVDHHETLHTWRDSAVLPLDQRTPGSYLTVRDEAIDTLAIHLAFVGLAVLLAYFTKRALMAIETTNDWLTEYAFFSGFPLFPMCMLWGLAIQLLVDKFCKVSPIEKKTMERISGISLDFLVLTAIATTNLDAVTESLGPLVVVILLGFGVQLLCFFFLAPMMLPDFWFERAIAEMGKSAGTTAIGLLLLREVDPKNKTPALKCFAAKQGLQEPFTGGGLWTSMALPLIVSTSNWVVFGISAGFILLSLGFWFFVFRKDKRGPMIQYKFDPKYNL